MRDMGDLLTRIVASHPSGLSLVATAAVLGTTPRSSHTPTHRDEAMSSNARPHHLRVQKAVTDAMVEWIVSHHLTETLALHEVSVAARQTLHRTSLPSVTVDFCASQDLHVAWILHSLTSCFFFRFGCVHVCLPFNHSQTSM